MNELQKLELEELQRLSAEELEGFNIDSLETLNWTFRKMSAINEKVKDIENLAKAERERIDSWEKKELEPHKNSLQFFERKVSEYHARVLFLDPKLKSIKTPYGVAKSLTKKAYPVKGNEEVLINYLKSNNPDYIKEIRKEDINWSEYKKTLQVVDGVDGPMVIDENGTIVEGVEVQPETITFKTEVK